MLPELKLSGPTPHMGDIPSGVHTKKVTMLTHGGFWPLVNETKSSVQKQTFKCAWIKPCNPTETKVSIRFPAKRYLTKDLNGN